MISLLFDTSTFSLHLVRFTFRATMKFHLKIFPRNRNGNMLVKIAVEEIIERMGKNGGTRKVGCRVTL